MMEFNTNVILFWSHDQYEFHLVVCVDMFKHTRSYERKKNDGSNETLMIKYVCVYKPCTTKKVD